MTCPFRDEATERCLIYEVRPTICQAFICNQSQEAIARNKIRFHSTKQPIAMRYEFFKNKEDVEWLNQ